ncbi:esterase [Flavobacteriaceae bacterium S0825]|uniref:alpha/beta hydrolase n=1 Tax=Gaetbulibacter sp. S0825 TaxID=2720084 RepID=UPI00142F9790|nr:esterase [Gaetbulibacter sp. S0825]MCK0109579.1 esterase [Flavobacteriaceae bacterium S0825]NIX65212.1 esterase [Gaetbulibacter sp. S0825]
MNSVEKEISYKTTNSYSTLNALTSKTKNMWFVCHGMGYLSRYFLKYFKELNPDENYIIAPQAQSKYYIQPAFKHVGASWLTKENTVKETDNVMHYFDAVFEAENIPKDKNLIVVGYSQGVSVAMRYLATRQLQCSQLVLMSGGIPKELRKKDFEFLKAQVTLIYGTADEYLSNERMELEKTRAFELFGNNLNINPFEGKHIVNVELINNLV